MILICFTHPQTLEPIELVAAIREATEIVAELQSNYPITVRVERID